MARIVYLCAHCPFGDQYGAALRARTVAEGLRLAGEVTLVPVGFKSWPSEAIQKASIDYNVTRQVTYVDVPPTFAGWLSRNLRRSTFATDSRTVRPNDRRMIEQLVDGADLVWVHTIGVANAIRIWRWPHSILDVDDLFSQYHFGRAALEHGTRKARAIWQAYLWKNREKTYLRRFERIVLCSEDDRQYLGAEPRMTVIPNTFDSSNIRMVRNPSATPRFGFVGTLEYAPNRDAVAWFSREVMPLILRAEPTAEFRVIGRGGPAFFEGEGLRGFPLDYIEDPTVEIATWTAMVVPVRYGGGTRVKVAEAFARGTPVVATVRGAFGYAVEAGRELLIADTCDEMARACLSIARDAELANRLAEAGRRCLKSTYDIENVRKKVRQVAVDVMSDELNRPGFPRGSIT